MIFYEFQQALKNGFDILVEYEDEPETISGKQHRDNHDIMELWDDYSHMQCLMSVVQSEFQVDVPPEDIMKLLLDGHALVSLGGGVDINKVLAIKESLGRNYVVINDECSPVAFQAIISTKWTLKK